MKRIVLVVLAALFALSCSGHPQELTLQIISPHPKMIQDEFGPAFEAYYLDKTGIRIKVVWRDMGGTSDDLRFIKSEFAKRPEGIDLDIFFGGGNDPYLQLKEISVLEPYRVPDEILSGIPADISGVPLIDKDYTWYGTAISGFGIIYNKPLLARLGAPEPKTWEDLANPALLTWVGAGDPRHSGTVHMMYEIILQAYGWQRGWQVLAAIAGNTRAFVQNAGDIARAVAAGQVAAGGAIDFYAWTQIDAAGPDTVAFVMPEGLSVVNTDSIGILKGAPHMEAARSFLDFVLSAGGQKIWYLKAGVPGGPRKSSLFRMPVRPSLYDEFTVESAVRTNPFKWGKSLQYDADLGTERYEALNDLIGATIVDTHELLAEAWKLGIEANAVEAVTLSLSQTPVTEQQLIELARTEMQDPVKRNARVADWVNASKASYQRLAAH